MDLSSAPTGFETIPPSATWIVLAVAFALTAVGFIREGVITKNIVVAGIFGTMCLGFCAATVVRIVSDANTPTHATRYAAIEHTVTTHAGPKARFEIVDGEVADPNKAFEVWLDVNVPGKPTVRCLAEFTVNQDPKWTCPTTDD